MTAPRALLTREWGVWSSGGGDPTTPGDPQTPTPPASSTTPDIFYGNIDSMTAGGFGSVSEVELESAFGVPIFYSGGLSNLAVVAGSDGKKYLRQQFIPDSGGSSSVQFGIKLGAHNEAYWSVEFMFETGFEFVKGGKLVGGLGGGTYPSGGNPPGPGEGFSYRYMWRDQSGIHTRVPRIEGYLYSSDQTQQYGDEIDLGPEAKNPPVGEWITLTGRAKLNTGANFDGELQTKLNGIDQGTYVTRLRNGGTYTVDQWRYSSFYGGSNSTWSPSKITYIRTRNFKCATVPTGIDGW